MNLNGCNYKIGRLAFTIPFFCLFILVSFFSILLNASSMRAGLSVSIVIFFVFFASTSNQFIINKSYLNIVIAIFFSILAQYLVSRTIYPHVVDSRFFLSYLLLFLIFITSALFANFSSSVREKSFHKVIVHAYTFLIVVAFTYLVLFKVGFIDKRAMFIFSEPSHFSLVFLPLLLFMLYNSSNFHRFFHLSASVILAVLLPSLTLLVGILICLNLLYLRKIFRFILLACLLGFILIWLKADSLDYFLDRLTISFDTANISVLVFLSGWERAYLSLVDSYGFGIGFQQLGIVGPTGEARSSLEAFNLGEVNLLDGGSLGSKIIAELGIGGLFLIVLYLLFFLKFSLRFIFQKVSGYADVFFMSVFVMFSIDLFVRGVGFFSPTSFMFLSSVYWLCSLRKQKKIAIIGHKLSI